MDNRIMIDLETMGSGPTAAIVSIGAVRFDTEKILGQFAVSVDLNSSMDCGMECDARTIMWWLKQSYEARQYISNGGVSLKHGLEAFANWIGDGAEVWGNGSDFDNVVLASAYRLCGMKQPWNYFNNRCFRTLRNMHPSISYEHVGVAHVALDDARSQALHAIKCLAAISI